MGDLASEGLQNRSQSEKINSDHTLVEFISDSMFFLRFDYSVVYNEADLGFEFHSSAKKKRAINAIVGKRVTEHAVRHIFQGSLMLAVNNTWVVGMPSTQIVEICEKALRQLPCTVTFRGKKWMRDSNDQRGTLKILINKVQFQFLLEQ